LPVALSVRQPWAALIAAGLKSVEVRPWPTRRRGPVLIHAGRIADDRPDAWALVTDPTVFELARLRGGVIGTAELTGCRPYDTADAFAADAAAHLNPPGWFAPPRLYGFVFRSARVVPFLPYPGRTLFFPVEGDVTAGQKTGHADDADKSADCSVETPTRGFTPGRQARRFQPSKRG
jgi:hypothetical protein